MTLSVFCKRAIFPQQLSAQRKHTEHIKEEVNEIGFFNMSNSSALPHDERRCSKKEQ